MEPQGETAVHPVDTVVAPYDQVLSVEKIEEVRAAPDNQQDQPSKPQGDEAVSGSSTTPVAESATSEASRPASATEPVSNSCSADPASPTGEAIEKTTVPQPEIEKQPSPRPQPPKASSESAVVEPKPAETSAEPAPVEALVAPLPTAAVGSNPDKHSKKEKKVSEVHSSDLDNNNTCSRSCICLPEQVDESFVPEETLATVQTFLVDKVGLRSGRVQLDRQLTRSIVQIARNQCSSHSQEIVECTHDLAFPLAQSMHQLTWFCVVPSRCQPALERKATPTLRWATRAARR